MLTRIYSLLAQELGFLCAPLTFLLLELKHTFASYKHLFHDNCYNYGPHYYFVNSLIPRAEITSLGTRSVQHNTGHGTKANAPLPAVGVVDVLSRGPFQSL